MVPEMSTRPVAGFATVSYYLGDRFISQTVLIEEDGTIVIPPEATRQYSFSIVAPARFPEPKLKPPKPEKHWVKFGRKHGKRW